MIVALVAGVRMRQEEAPIYDIPFSAQETITLWDFQGAYTGYPELEAKATTEIERLRGLLGTGEYSDYTLYVSIANQYDLLGDGAMELKELEHALAIDSTSTGLAWHNAGKLFAHLGAYETARYALEQAVAAQPIAQYRVALIDLLKEHFPNDLEAIDAGERAVDGAIEVNQ